METKFDNTIINVVEQMKKEVALKTIEKCLEIVATQTNIYANLRRSPTGEEIRDNAKGRKWMRINDTYRSLIKKEMILEAIEGKIYEMECDIRRNGLSNY